MRSDLFQSLAVMSASRQLLVQEPVRSDTGVCGHREDSFRSTVEGLPKDHAMTALHAYDTPITERLPYTTLPYTTLLDATPAIRRATGQTAGGLLAAPRNT